MAKVLIEFLIALILAILFQYYLSIAAESANALWVIYNTQLAAGKTTTEIEEALAEDPADVNEFYTDM